MKVPLNGVDLNYFLWVNCVDLVKTGHAAKVVALCFDLLDVTYRNLILELVGYWYK